MNLLNYSEMIIPEKITIDYSSGKFKDESGEFYDGIVGELLGFKKMKKQYNNEVYETFNIFINTNKIYKLQINIKTHLCFTMLNQLMSLPDYDGIISIRAKKNTKFVNITINYNDDNICWMYDWQQLENMDDAERQILKEKMISELIAKAPYCST